MTRDTMIVSAEAWLVDLAVETKRTDAVQSVPEAGDGVRRADDRRRHDRTRVHLHHRHRRPRGARDAAIGLLDAVIGHDADRREAVWHAAFNSTRATTVGRDHLAGARRDRYRSVGCLLASQRHPALEARGGASPSVPIYDTEGGWLHLSPASS